MPRKKKGPSADFGESRKAMNAAVMPPVAEGGPKKGFLVVLEGIDGTGKSTQARALLRRLRAAGVPAARFREPSRGRWGREIRRLARTAGSVTPEEELELFVKDRRENVERNLKPALAAGKVVVLDRYYFSTVAYQGAKGLDPVRIRRLNERFAPRPDLVFILDLDPAGGLARIAGRGRRDELFEREDYLARVREIFRSFKGRKFVPLDAGRGKRALGRSIWERVRRLALPRPI
jgi:dTMP kinase